MLSKCFHIFLLSILFYSILYSKSNLIVSFTNEEFLPLTLNWYISIKKNILCRGSQNVNVLIFCEENNVCNILKKFNIPYIDIDNYNKKLEIKVHFGTKEYKWLTFKKPHLISRFLESQKINNILFSDTDCVFLRNDIFDDIKKYNKNIIFQSDNRFGDVNDKTNVNSGFYYIKNKNKVKEIFLLWNTYLNRQNIGNTSKIYGDQDVLQYVLKTNKNHFEWNIFDSTLYPNGKVYFDMHVSQKHGIIPFMIHNNWIVGIKGKIERFKKNGLWFLSNVRGKFFSSECSLPNAFEKIKSEFLYISISEVKKIQSYVIHYSKLIKRKESLQKILTKENIKNIQWMQFPIREKLQLQKSIKNEYYRFNQSVWNQKCKIIRQSGFYHPYEKGVLSDGIIGNGISHILAWKDILKSETIHDFALVMEDDVVLINNFLNLLYEYIIQLPPNWDILFIGNEFNTKKPYHINYENGKNIYRKKYTRTVDGYVIRKKTLENLLKYIVPFNLPIDHELGYWVIKLNLSVYHSFPGLIKQGSIHNGNISSSLRFI